MDEIFCLYFSFVLIFLMIYSRETMEGIEIILITLFAILGIIALSVIGENSLFVIIGLIIAGFNLKQAAVNYTREIGGKHE